MKKRYSERTTNRRNQPTVGGNKGTKVEICTTINRTPGELFAFWRNFENLPRVMAHVESVQSSDDTHSHWRIRSKDKVIEWDAEVINEQGDEMIAWRTTGEADVEHAGSIWFIPGPGGLGTEVKLVVEYNLSGLTDLMAKLYRRSPEQQMREDLRHFK